ncbi:filamin-A-like [Oreochromis aureus]|uniref:filamin-A-like n=1 Tax=Oreochromis aureus TaxID=47969 RepID=UPI0019545653|nr:filamin-A-like [Oreochromis aureus]
MKTSQWFPLWRPPTLRGLQRTSSSTWCLILKKCDQGSDFTVKVTGEGRMKASVTRKRTAASVAKVDSQCDLSLKIPEISIAEGTAQVTRPSGQVNKADTMEGENNTCCICFVPSETGVHAVCVKYNGTPGSNFTYNYTVAVFDTGGCLGWYHRHRKKKIARTHAAPTSWGWGWHRHQFLWGVFTPRAPASCCLEHA